MSNEPLLKLELPGVKKLKSGKVREVFDLGERLLFVATDRISAFDCVMPNGIPRKGEVLTQISYFWFDQTAGLVAQSPGRQGGRPAAAGIGKVFRDVGPAQHGGEQGPAAGHRMRGARLFVGLGLEGLPEERLGLRPSSCPPACANPSRLPEPLFTPATKAETGHDENISFDQACEITGRDIAEKARELSLKIYSLRRRIMP